MHTKHSHVYVIHFCFQLTNHRIFLMLVTALNFNFVKMTNKWRKWLFNNYRTEKTSNWINKIMCALAAFICFVQQIQHQLNVECQWSNFFLVCYIRFVCASCLSECTMYNVHIQIEICVLLIIVLLLFIPFLSHSFNAFSIIFLFGLHWDQFLCECAY